jgi:hypothetical protein
VLKSTHSRLRRRGASSNALSGDFSGRYLVGGFAEPDRLRAEVYVPDLPAPHYRNLLLSFEEEFTYAFGGCTIVRGLDGNYLSQAGFKTPDRINVIYTDLPVALSTSFDRAARYADQLKQAAFDALAEETVLVAVGQIYHAV